MHTHSCEGLDFVLVFTFFPHKRTYWRHISVPILEMTKLRLKVKELPKAMQLLCRGDHRLTQCFQVTFPDSLSSIACWRPQYPVLFLISIRFWFVDYIDIILKHLNFFSLHIILADIWEMELQHLRTRKELRDLLLGDLTFAVTFTVITSHLCKPSQ